MKSSLRSTIDTAAAVIAAADTAVSVPKKRSRTVSFHSETETFPTLDIDDYTPTEVQHCWWFADELKTIRDACKMFVSQHYSHKGSKNKNKNNNNNKDCHSSEQEEAEKEEQFHHRFRGLERFTHVHRRAVLNEISREAILYDQCLYHYTMNSRMALREAQERARLDALAVVVGDGQDDDTVNDDFLEEDKMKMEWENNDSGHGSVASATSVSSYSSSSSSSDSCEATPTANTTKNNGGKMMSFLSKKSKSSRYLPKLFQSK
ncbi:hypothetical protein IV203_033552 [Nitzschia inconspicua]|uniref:Uncharacterized protein n=1 Tax=Nitzschia inconspicua TaxID=303405 RepID=A0A9K3M329_9STRA|nr:hypothetical protein IV203_023741 [Nitzschia inconspicua]KAG7372828.1 hypothetical protein IV203_033552 [Nitzschia inconspicua]